jgi:hypothetical protein
MIILDNDFNYENEKPEEAVQKELENFNFENIDITKPAPHLFEMFAIADAL